MTATDPFTLDARLAADTRWLAATPACELLLMNDARWPWLILVPRQAGASELHELDATLAERVFADIALASRAMQRATGCRSVNVAALGNVVAQLHVHVVARDEGDTNWPRPVWGAGVATPYTATEPPTFAAEVAAALRAAPERSGG